MKSLNKKIGIVAIIGVLALGVYLLIYYNSVTDVENVKIEGYVYDKDSKKPISGALVIINNDRYTSDSGKQNYDEYLGHDTIKISTNDSGYYSFTLEKSAFVWLDIYKDGYWRKKEKARYASKLMNYKAYLKKK